MSKNFRNSYLQTLSKIQSLHPDFKPEVIGGLIQFIADWSAVGARSQMGFGVIQVEGNRIDTQPLYDWLVTTAGSDTYSDLPSLQNIFLAKIQPKASTPPFKEQDTFNLKYDLRKLFRTDVEANDGKDGDGKSRPKKKDRDKDLRHFIMGAASDDKNNKRDDKTEGKSMAAKIKISRPYNENGTTVMRVWGWIPKEDDCKKDLYKNGWNREKVVEVIYQYLTASYTLHGWREMNSKRDTVTANQTDVQAFLHSLLQLQEDD